MKHELFTVEHFEAYTSQIVLDSGQHWRLEDFQAQIAESTLEPIRRLTTGQRHGGAEVWAVLPEGNAKTTLLAGLALYLCDYAPLPWIPVAASTRDQAEILAQQAYQMVRMSPGMLSRFRIYEGYRRIQPRRPGHPAPGRRGIKVLAADASTGDGVIPYPLAICDEGHRHQDMRLYRLWRGKLMKRGGLIVMISTAGVPGHEFEQLREEIRGRATASFSDGCHLVSKVGDRVVMHEWMLLDVSHASDMEKVKEANPLSTITVEELRQQFESPTTDMGSWMRLKCNIASRSVDAAVSQAEWEMARTDVQIAPGSRVTLGVDVAWKHDTFSIVPLWDATDYRVLGAPAILVPPRDGSSMHPDIAKSAFEDFLNRYVVEDVVIDMGRAEDVAAWLEDYHGLRVIDWPTGNAQAARDYERFMSGLRDGTLLHTGDSGLKRHVLNAVSRPLPGDRRRFDRPSSSRNRRQQDDRVIDALMAAAMVNSFVFDSKPTFAGKLSDYRIQQM